jgi:hypothetical protein
MKKVLFIAALWLCLFSKSTHATVIFVDSSHVAIPGISTGTSWATAFSNFQTAIDAAVAMDTIWVAKGTYKATLTSFRMKEGVKIFGGFVNTNVLFHQRNWQNNITILEGNDSHVIDNSTNNLTTASVIDGFIIKGGKAEYGGGICNINASPTIKNVIITSNSGSWGGGMYNKDAAPVLANVIIKNNIVGDTINGYAFGGGICNDNASPVITNAEITGNIACWGGGMLNMNGASPLLENVIINNNTSAYEGIGGGMCNIDSSSPILHNVIISGNKAIMGGSGGGIYNRNNSSPILTNVTISNNTAAWFGGGIYNINSAPILNHVIITGDTARDGAGVANYYLCAPVFTDVILSENVAVGDDNFMTGTGGGIYSENSTLTLHNVTFKNNTAMGDVRCGYGGAIYSVSSSSTLTNVIISGNKATGGYAGGWGGGIVASHSPLTLTNVAITNNMATCDGYNSYGGGLFFDDNMDIPIKLTNLTISNNNAVIGGGIYNNASTPTLTNCILYGNNTGVISGFPSATPEYFYSLIQDMPAGTNAHNLDGTIDPLFVDTANGDYRLRFDSPCINKGNNDSIPAGIITDLAGNNRIAYDTVDMGAYEYKLAVSLGNDTTFCSNTGWMLRADNAGASYLWNTGATTQNIRIDTAGTYIVEVSNSWGVATDSISVTVAMAPIVNLGNDVTVNVPFFTLDAGNNGATYLWNTGATSQSITVNTDGMYSVHVTNSFGCSASDTIVVTFDPTGISNTNASENRITIVPNPARETVHIYITDPKLLFTQAILCNTYGRVVRMVTLENKSQLLSLAGLAQGIYILKMENGVTTKIVKE